jgi:hypothetical protein
MESLFRLKNNSTLLMVIAVAVIFFVFILPMIDGSNITTSQAIKEGLENTDEKIDTNTCSRQCCNHSQWAVPKDMLANEISEEQMKNYVPTNMSCNFGKGSGCVCATKDQIDNLSQRGGNAGSK